MRTGHRVLLLTGAAVAASAAVAQPAQKVTGPVAVYWMSASTQSGFGMPSTGGGRPSMGQIMAMMNGGGGAQHSLLLQLGSSDHPSGPPSAEHLPPAGLGAGPSLPLVSPETPPRATHEEAPDKPQIPPEFQRPKGRMLIFWGCGEHARPGQPVVLDFAEMSAGKVPPGMALLGKGLDVRRMQPPSARRYAAYGDWPNAKSRTTVPGTGSLVGQHTIHGDYSPEIKFALSPNQDFLGPLILTTNTKSPGGSAQLGWAPVQGAQAYAATVVGAGAGRSRDETTVVLWSSSETQAAAFALPDYIAPSDLARGVETHTLMGPQATSCQVPKEVVDAAPQGFVQMVAYGAEANFVYPPRPADPKVAWNRQWEVKVRYRSATGGLLGMTIPTTGGGRGAPGGSPNGAQAGQDPASPQDAAAARRRAILNGLGGLIPH
ncbi:MAG TPA: hypothetical protein VFE10_00560 [Phenylobacterium sp.]|jgi:hypothetical protein|nr:hypothetical protein [Phenylobacterium sp.]